MRVILIPPGEKPRPAEWSTLAEAQALVGGALACVFRDCQVTAYANADARDLRLPFNARATQLLRLLQKADDVFLGPLLVCGPVDRYGGDTPVVPEIEKRLLG